jgi:hypothetical protein
LGEHVVDINLDDGRPALGGEGLLHGVATANLVDINLDDDVQELDQRELNEKNVFEYVGK